MIIIGGRREEKIRGRVMVSGRSEKMSREGETLERESEATKRKGSRVVF